MESKPDFPVQQNDIARKPMTLKQYILLRRKRKQLLAAANRADALRRMERHLVAEQDDDALRNAIAAAREAASSAKDGAAIDAAGIALENAVSRGPWHPLHRSAIAENFEVLLVAVAVAMAFRCYFLQPFKIPTGSMQPTLYGIHVESWTKPTLWDRRPLKYIKWALTGDWYTEVRVKQGGTLLTMGETVKPGYVTIKVAGRKYHVPAEAVVKHGHIDLSDSKDIRRDGTIPSGGVIWAGTVKAGDHVFVNRVAWNFRRPRRGDVMVFSTTGIKGLSDGMHYIKRMSGLPGEKVAIWPPNLVINDEIVKEPHSIGRISERRRIAPDEPPFAGYVLIATNSAIRADTPSPLCAMGDSVHLGEGEYYALGDNTTNSRDSRYWGPVPARNLLGPAAFIYWPFTRIRLID